MNENTQTPNFVFWIHPWKRWLFILSKIDRARVIKCVITDQEIRTEAAIASNKPPIRIRLESVEEIDAGVLHGGTNLFAVRIVTTLKPEFYTIVPTNPFEPTLSFQSNKAESYAMYEIIKTLKDRKAPEYDSNPYKRQLKKAIPWFVPDGDEWDENISPWYYFSKYQQDLNKKRKVIDSIFVALTVVFVLASSLYWLWHFLFP